MSKEFLHGDRDADGHADRVGDDGVDRSGDFQQDGPIDRDADVTGGAGTDRDAEPRPYAGTDRDGDAFSATRVVFGMGSMPDDVDPRLDPAERESLEAAGIDPDAVANKEYSYRMLLDRGVDEPLAADLRRRFSLPWSFENDGDLDRRSSEVRGLGDAEREWIAVSGDENWQSFEYTESREIDVERDAPADRPYPRPTPVTAVTGVGPDDADRLAEAGVVSAERLATVDAFAIANALDFDVLHVRTWRHNARELVA
ncbi:hypothetical protein ACFO5R_21505 [Halosolutus amylolyticus]|uniref:DUF7409 domain-containing protein n=1 Tax=Halosolutus amylolyticus TaxID=2932267 RepID=A0ABD5PVA7_9EURY|nr:hypothetical protein [Halosolutus amylolyticus]